MMFNKLNKIVAFALGLMILASCQKEEFRTEEGTPVFTADIAILDESSVNLVAGDDSYYMYTSHLQTPDEKVLKGLFGKLDICEEDCLQNFAIEIHQKEDAIGEIRIGNYEYFSIPRNGFKHNYSVLSSDPDASPENASWRVGDQTHFGSSLSVDSDNDSAPGEGIKMIYKQGDQFTIQMERRILPMAANCDIEVKIDPVPGQGAYLEIISSGAFSIVNWSTGETGKKIFIDFSVSSYSASVFDASGCKTDIILGFNTKNIDDVYQIGFNQNSEAFATPDNADHTVNIMYTDAQGVFYTSSVIGQILPFDFEILDVSEYEENELGNPTKKITAKFNCILFGNDGSTKRIQDSEAVFAVSY